MQDSVNAYYVLLSVTLQQEVAVRRLFQNLQWTLHCLRVPPSLSDSIESFLDENQLQLGREPDCSTGATDEGNIDNMVSAIHATKNQVHPKLYFTEMITDYITIEELKQYLSDDILSTVLDQTKMTDCVQDITNDKTETRDAVEDLSDTGISDADVQNMVLRNTEECLKKQFSHKALRKKKNDLKIMWKKSRLKSDANPRVEKLLDHPRLKQSSNIENTGATCTQMHYAETVVRKESTKSDSDVRFRNDKSQEKCANLNIVSTDAHKEIETKFNAFVQCKNKNSSVTKEQLKGRKVNHVPRKAIRKTEKLKLQTSDQAKRTLNLISRDSESNTVDKDNVVSADVVHYSDTESTDGVESATSSCHSDVNKVTVSSSNSTESNSPIRNKPLKGSAQWKCSYCNMSFDKLSRTEQLSHFTSHFNNSEDEPKQMDAPLTTKSLECNMCGKKLASTKWLSRHMRLSHLNGKVKKKKKRYAMSKCSICKKEMSSHSISAHMKAMHDENRTGFVCDICGAYLMTQGNLKHHREIVHTDIRPHTCNICNLSFKAISTYKVHMRRHDPDGKQTCPTCGKTVSFGQLGQHMKRHTNNKKHQCESCDKAFYEKQDLLRHERVHSGDKPFKCTLCTYSCALRGNLKKHMNSHNIADGPARLSHVSKDLKQKIKQSDNNVVLTNTTSREDSITKHDLPVYDTDKYANMTAVDLTGVNPMFQSFTQLLSITQTHHEDTTDIQQDGAGVNGGPGELKIVDVTRLSDKIQNVESAELSHLHRHYSDLTLSTPLQISQQLPQIDSERDASMILSDHMHRAGSTHGTEVSNSNINKPIHTQDTNTFPDVSRGNTCNIHNANTPEDAYRHSVDCYAPNGAASYTPVDMHDSMRNSSASMTHLQASLLESTRPSSSDVHHLMKAYPYFFQTYQQ